MHNNAIIKVSKLRKYFDEIRAVDGISFDVNSGEIFGLLGPNGAGKTTTIKILLGLLEPLEGNMSIFGYNPQREDIFIKDRVGYVAEEPLIFKSLTPRGLFNFISSIRRLDQKLTTTRAREYLESFDAIEFYEQIISSLSHGSKQKIQFITALLHNPDLLILDEPLSGLDAKSVRVAKEILEIHTQNGGSVLFSTHIMEIAEEICDRICIINKGKMVGIGTINELREQTNKIGASLEDIFLRLTEQDNSVLDIVNKLRKSFQKKRGLN